MTTLYAGQTESIFIQRGKRLTVQVSALGAVIAQRMKDGVMIDQTEMPPSEVQVFGEYHTDLTVVLNCFSGSAECEVTQSYNPINVSVMDGVLYGPLGPLDLKK